MASAIDLSDNATSSDLTQPTKNIFDLPKEIRNLIYALYFGSPTLTICWPRPRYESTERIILSVSHQVKGETENQLYLDTKVIVQSASALKRGLRPAKLFELVRHLKYPYEPLYEEEDSCRLELMPNLRTLVPDYPGSQVPKSWEYEPANKALLAQARKGIGKCLAGFECLWNAVKAHPKLQAVVFEVRSGLVLGTGMVAEKV